MFIFGLLCSLGYITNANLFPEPLAYKDELKYFELYKKNDDKNARKILIEKNLRLVAHITKKFCNTIQEQEDYISIGTIGLIKAIESFDYEKGTRFATYGARCIENEILMYIRVTKKQQNEISIYNSIGSDKEGNDITLIDILENEEVDLNYILDMTADVKKMCQKMHDVLSIREKRILEYRFGLKTGTPLTQNEVATLEGISRSYVSRIETKALEKLSEVMK